MNLPGGLKLDWWVIGEILRPMSMVYPGVSHCGRPPRESKRFEDLHVEKLPVQPQHIMGSVLAKLSGKPRLGTVSGKVLGNGRIQKRQRGY